MAQSMWITLCGIGEVPSATFFFLDTLGSWKKRKGNFYAGDEQMFKEMLQLKTSAGRGEERKHAFQSGLHGGTRWICFYQYPK